MDVTVYRFFASDVEEKAFPMRAAMSGIGRWNRRDWLRLSTGGIIFSSVARSAAASVETIEIIPTPAQPEGDYFREEDLLRSDIRIDPATNVAEAGFPLTLALTVSRIQGNTLKPLGNACVHLWQCNAAGLYSNIREQSTAGLQFLRGHQFTDSRGSARFTTIFPGWETGRTPHLNFKIRLYESGEKAFELTSQLYFEEGVTGQVYARWPYCNRPDRDTTNETDSLCKAGGAPLMLGFGKDPAYALATAHIMVSASKE
jgi:protocatechuate 3,4-dioxygenase beta subunit